MKPILITLLLLSTSAYAQHYEGSWAGTDKKKHFMVSAALGVVSGTVIENKWAAFGVALAPGIAWEIGGACQTGNGFSKRDLIADALGVALGVQGGPVVRHWIIEHHHGATLLTYTSEF